MSPVRHRGGPSRYTDRVSAYPRPRPKGRYTSAEQHIIERLVAILLAERQPVKAVHVFGSRARGHSRMDSDLDLAIELTVTCTREDERHIMALGETLSLEDAHPDRRLRVQTVPVFADEKEGAFFRSIAPDLDTVWTRT